MPATQSQSRPRKGSVGATKTSTGLQLLSPTLQQSIQNSASKLSSSHPAEFFGWSTTPTSGGDDSGLGSSFVSADASKKVENDPAAFDFDGLTLASVRGREKSQHQASSGSSTRSNSRIARSSSMDRRPQPDTTTDYCAFYYNDIEGSKANPLSCSMGSVQTTTTTEDFEMSRRLHQQSFQKRRTSVMNRDGNTNRATFQTSATAAAAGFPMAKKKELTAVVVRGWLQKRKGLMIKRWKPYFCLFKSDDSLCLYTSEDTVNGKLEQRYQVLRVQLTDKNDSFHIIGVDADGTPRREEFRASVSPEWTCWFQVLGKFFDEKSMTQALARKPELTIPQAIDESEAGRTRNSNDWVDTLSDVAVPPRTNMSSFQQHHDERHSYFSHRKQSSAAVRNSFDGSGEDLTSTVSTFSGSTVPSSGSSNQPNENAAKSGNQKLSDCPMIERKSQATVPILEVSAKLDTSLAAAMSSSFSWSK